jgi:hypothetical protein
MCMQFQNIQKIDCSSFNLEKKGTGYYFDLTHLTLKELENISFSKAQPYQMKAAWSQLIYSLSFDELCSVSLPSEWITSIKEKTLREQWLFELRQTLVDAWYRQLVHLDCFIIYFSEQRPFSESSFDCFLEALSLAEKRWLDHHQEQPKISLFLAQMNLNDTAIYSFQKHLSTCTSLVYLDLDNNPITKKSAKELAQFLKQQEGLKVMQLSGTQLSDEGLLCLLEGIKANKSLREIYLGKEEYSEKTRAQIAQKMEKHSHSVMVEFTPQKTRPIGRRSKHCK